MSPSPLTLRKHYLICNICIQITRTTLYRNFRAFTKQSALKTDCFDTPLANRTVLIDQASAYADIYVTNQKANCAEEQKALYSSQLVDCDDKPLFKFQENYKKKTIQFYKSYDNNPLLTFY